MTSSALRGTLLFACAAALSAQQGLESAWDIGGVLQEISSHSEKMMPLLDRIDFGKWVEKGAPDAYAAQLQSSKDQARSIAETAKNLARHPEQLAATIEVYFRVQGLETVVASLSEAMRRYESPEAAQALVAYVAQNGQNRDRLQRYIVNLADQRERDLQIMDREAQRCRSIITAPAPAPAKAGKKK